jgi:hypothetical protein
MRVPRTRDGLTGNHVYLFLLHVANGPPAKKRNLTIKAQSDSNFHCGVGGVTVKYSEQVEARNSPGIAYRGRKENGQE